MPPATTVRSFAKINLGLRIGPPQPDGFHALHTLYQTIAMHDLVTVTAEPASATAVTLDCNHPRVPTDGRNTAVRMVSLALTELGVNARVHIHIEKQLPMQGGLGAGSANAAAALLGLERQLGLALPPAERLRLAETVGSDVPLFLLGGTVYGHGRGEIVLPYPDLPATHCVVALPNTGSSTPLAFRMWDDERTQLTPRAAHDRLTELSRVYASAFAQAGSGREAGASGVSGAFDKAHAGTRAAGAIPIADGDLAGNPLLALVRTGIENDFEEVVFQLHPSLREIKQALLGSETGLPSMRNAPGRAICASLSGSGSSLFGLYRGEADAAAAQERVSALGTRAVATTTLPRDRYWQQMF